MSFRRHLAVPLSLGVSFALVGGALAAAPFTSLDGAGPQVVAAPAAVPAAAKKPVSCSVGPGVTAKQVVVVRATGSRATVKGCTRTAAGKYVVSRGPYSGHVGRNGVAKKGGKREGDGKTPWGVYKLRGGFGAYKNPGVKFKYFKTDSRDRWVDDSSSKYYNLHKRAPANGRWKSAEKLRAMVPSYNYAQVIGYNEKRTPGRGSAIFLHVDTGRGTAGCVSIKQSSLLKLLRWQKPGAQITIKRAAKKTVAKKSLASSSVAAASLVSTAAALPAYTSSSRKAKRSDVKHSWRKGCPVGVGSLRVLRLRYYGWDKKAHMGTLVVNKSAAKDMRAIFRKLYDTRYPIRKMVPVDVYKGSDRKSMKADNTSAFNCRNVAGTSNWSNHAYGLAIDVNPRENPYVNGKTVSPPAGRAYLNRKVKKKGMIQKNGRVVKAFRAQGFRWGGLWYDPDYQHFDRR